MVVKRRFLFLEDRRPEKDEEKKKVAEKEVAPESPEKMSSPKKPALVKEKTDAGEKSAELDISESDLEGRLVDLFADVDDMPVVKDSGLKPEAALPDRKKEKNKIKTAGAVKSKKEDKTSARTQSTAAVAADGGNVKGVLKETEAAVIKKKAAFDSRPQKTAPKPPDKAAKTEKEKKVDLPLMADAKKAPDKKHLPKTSREYKRDPVKPFFIIDESDMVTPEKSRKRANRNKFVLGGILMVLAVVVSYVIFKSFARVEGDEPQQTVITHKIKQPPVKIQTKTAMPPSDTVIGEKTEPAASGDTVSPPQIPEAKKAAPSVEKEKDVLKAPAVSYPYSIHVESYRSLQAAKLSAETYRKTGLQAFWVRIDLGEKGIWYRVFIGCYKDTLTAQETIKEKQLRDARPVRVRYATFIGTYLSDDDLKNQSRFLSERGYSPYFIQDDNGKNYLYTGVFDTLQEAEKLSVELSSKGIRSLVVER